MGRGQQDSATAETILYGNVGARDSVEMRAILNQISDSQLACLAALQNLDFDREDGIMVKSVEQYLNKNKFVLNPAESIPGHVLRNLAKQGLAQASISDNPSDYRAYLYALTSKGEAVINRVDIDEIAQQLRLQARSFNQTLLPAFREMPDRPYHPVTLDTVRLQADASAYFQDCLSFSGNNRWQVLRKKLPAEILASEDPPGKETFKRSSLNIFLDAYKDSLYRAYKEDPKNNREPVLTKCQLHEWPSDTNHLSVSLDGKSSLGQTVCAHMVAAVEQLSPGPGTWHRYHTGGHRKLVYLNNSGHKLYGMIDLWPI